MVILPGTDSEFSKPIPNRIRQLIKFALQQPMPTKQPELESLHTSEKYTPLADKKRSLCALSHCHNRQQDACALVKGVQLKPVCRRLVVEKSQPSMAERCVLAKIPLGGGSMKNSAQAASNENYCIYPNWLFV